MTGAGAGAAELVRGLEGERWDPAYEATTVWRPVGYRTAMPLTDIRRFVDGAARARLIARATDPRGESVALVGGQIGALAARLEAGGRLVSEEREGESTARRTVLALATDGFGETDLGAFRKALGDVDLLDVTPRREGHPLMSQIEQARSAAQTRITTEMQRLERLVAETPWGGAPDLITVVDGKLATHLATEERARWPLIGVIKRHQGTLLPARLQEAVLDLGPAERSPVFRIAAEETKASRPEILSWYVRTSGGAELALSGMIRVEVTRTFFEEEMARRAMGIGELASAISARLASLRAVKGGYSREDCSLMPIVMIEDRLHALFGDMHASEIRLRSRLGLMNQTIRQEGISA